MQISDQKGIFHPCVHGDVINKAKKFTSYTFVMLEIQVLGLTHTKIKRG